VFVCMGSRINKLICSYAINLKGFKIQILGKKTNKTKLNERRDQEQTKFGD
jgi:hypothetical protein